MSHVNLPIHIYEIEGKNGQVFYMGKFSENESYKRISESVYNEAFQKLTFKAKEKKPNSANNLDIIPVVSATKSLSEIRKQCIKWLTSDDCKQKSAEYSIKLNKLIGSGVHGSTFDITSTKKPANCLK